MSQATIDSFLEENPEWKICPDLLAAPPNREELEEEFSELDESFLSRCDEVMFLGVSRGAQYWQMRQNGQSHRFAEMIALQTSPGIETDDTFFQGAKPLYDQFGSQKHLDRYLKAAKRRGFTPPVNSTYFPGLARFQGDPEAFVTRSMGRSYIRKLCEKRGWACEGAVKVDHREPDTDPLSPENCIPMGEDIMRKRASMMASKDPTIAKLNRKELREKILAKHGPSK